MKKGTFPSWISDVKKHKKVDLKSKKYKEKSIPPLNAFNISSFLLENILFT